MSLAGTGSALASLPAWVPLVVILAACGIGAAGVVVGKQRLHGHIHLPLAGGIVLLAGCVVVAMFALAGTGGAPSPATSPKTLGAVSFDVIPIIEGIEDTDPTNEVPDYPDGFIDFNGLLFVVQGDGEVRLADLDILLSKGTDRVTLTSTTPFPATDSADPSLTAYLEEVGDGDGLIEPGEWLMVYADACFINSRTSGSAVSWQSADTSSPMTVYVGDSLTYALYDRMNSKTLQEGQITFSPPS
jgi:hypothetical protein